MTVPQQTWIGTNEPVEAEFEPIANKDDPPHKPSGGLWTSSAFIKNGHVYSDWLRWVETESFYNDAEVVYTLEPEEREYDILRVHTQFHLEALLERYGRDDAIPTQTLAPLDFEAMASDYDAIHLTEQGQRETRMSRPGLYGWDSETYLWFEWVFTEVTDSVPITRIVE